MALTAAQIKEAKLEAIAKMKEEIKGAAKLLSLGAVRYLVDGYYQTQEYRKATANQFRALVESGETNPVPFWFFDQAEKMEKNLKNLMNVWTDQYLLGRWSKSIVGIGPIISAGLMANIDMKKAPAVGHIHMFAGLNASPFMLRDGEVIQSWEKGQKRPWNASLKTLCWNIGQSFMKQQSRENDYYGKFYRERKDYEIRQNEAFQFRSQAEEILKNKKIGKNTIAYSYYIKGQLPPAHIDARARRWTVKFFLSHYHHVAHEIEFGKPPEAPFLMAHKGHVHYIPPPNWPMA